MNISDVAYFHQYTTRRIRVQGAVRTMHNDIMRRRLKIKRQAKQSYTRCTRGNMVVAMLHVGADKRGSPLSWSLSMLRPHSTSLPDNSDMLDLLNSPV